MKTSSAFRLSKTAKRALAIITDSTQRSAWKRSLVNAEAVAQVQPRSRNKSK
jgi:hypothetical protein